MPSDGISIIKRVIWTAASIAFLPLQVVGLSPDAQAAEYHGRATFGGFFSKETFADPLDTTPSNDFATVSTRLYTEISKLGAPGLQLTADFRDTHDFFDKLDRERLTLTAANRLQVRHLAIKMPSAGTSSFYGSLGRFPIPEAGAVFADGAELGLKWNPAFSSAVFGGLDPKSSTLSYLTWQPDAQIFGGYLLYQPSYRSWGASHYASHALVTQRYGSETDRTFLYQQLMYQPNPRQRLLTNIYLDLVPRIFVQNGMANYYQELTDRWSFNAGISAIDVIEYTRRQGVREHLDPSPYREGSLQAVLRATDRLTYALNTSHGKRLADGLWRHEYSAKINLSQVWSRRYSVYGGLGMRRNFDANQYFARLGGGYYSDHWEVTVDQSTTWERSDSGAVLLPISLELGVAHYFARSLYATLAFNLSADSRVSIFGGFFKLAYRFGTRETSPVRDGAPPRGEL